MNENEDLRTRMSKAESKIQDLEELVQTLAVENFDLRASLAEIKLLLKIQSQSEDQRQSCIPSGDSQSSSKSIQGVNLENSAEVEEPLEKFINNEDPIAEIAEDFSLAERQSLQNPSTFNQVGSQANYRKALSLFPTPRDNRVNQSDNPALNLNNNANPIEESEDAGIFKPKRLFENLLVIGVPKEELSDYLNNCQVESESDSFISEMGSSNEMNRTKILFNFAESAQAELNITVPDIEKFITPSDFRVIDLEDDSKAANKVFVKTVLKSQRKYNRKYICPFQPSNDGVLLKWHKEVDTFNPQRKLYAVCIKKRDYVVGDDDNQKDPKVISVDTIYCMLTYYPIPSLLFSLLTSILNLIRKTRKQIYWDLGGKDRKKMDYGILYEILSTQVKDYVKILLTLPRPMPSDTIEYLFNNDNTGHQEVREYSYGLNSQAYLELACWQACKTFARFSLENIKLLVSALLLEKWVIFISRDIVTLTSVLNTILGLLCPFKYLHSIVPNLPPHLVRLCGAPVPITICINQKEDYFWNTRLYENSQNIFVFLDSQIIYVDSAHPEFLKLPVLNCLSQGIEDVYKELNTKNSSFDIVTNLDELKRVHPIKIAAVPENFGKEKENWKEDKEKCQRFFKHFRTQLERNVAVNMTYFKGYSPAQSQNLNLEQQIEEFIKNENNKEFFYSFITTQGFLTYPDY